MITIFGEQYSSKNSRRIFRAGHRIIVAKSAKSKQAESGILFQLREQRKEWLRMLEMCSTYPVVVAFKLYRKTNGIFDSMNLVQNAVDMMIVAEYLVDDNARMLIPIFDLFEVDPQNPRLEIKILNETVKNEYLKIIG